MSTAVTEREVRSSGGAAKNSRQQQEAMYSKSIAAYSAALDVVSKAITALDAISTGGAKVGSKREELSLLRGFLGFKKAMRQFSLNKRLAVSFGRRWKAQLVRGKEEGTAGDEAGRVNMAVRAEDIVHLYGALRQIVEEAAQLPGVADDDDLVDELNAKAAAARACRCYYLAESYASTRDEDKGEEEREDIAEEEGDDDEESRGSKKAAKATEKAEAKKLMSTMALYTHAGDLLVLARDLLEACDQGDDETNVGEELRELEELSVNLGGAKSRAQAIAFLQAGSSGATNMGARRAGRVEPSLISRLSECETELGQQQQQQQQQQQRRRRRGKKDGYGGGKYEGKNKKGNKEGVGGNGGFGGGSTYVYRVAALPPALRAVPCKPMVFDLAHNFLETPGFDSKVRFQGGKSSERQDGEAGIG